jgi:hypothetical protein
MHRHHGMIGHPERFEPELLHFAREIHRVDRIFINRSQKTNLHVSPNIPDDRQPTFDRRPD